VTIVVLSSLALKGVLEKSQARFEQALGESLEMQFDSTQAIVPRLAAGFRADLLVLTAEAMEDLKNKKFITEMRALGSSGVGVAVRAGARKPDIGSLDALKRSLAAAASVAHSKSGASGLYFAELIERLKFALKKRVVVEKGPVGAVVAAGKAEIGVQLLCELAPVPGIEIVGPLPAAIQKVVHFSAGIPTDAANARGAAALVELLLAAPVAMRDSGMEPATS
jgi:molybdate transport system substrate-binding protein